jgi:hypothetical protein
MERVHGLGSRSIAFLGESNASYIAAASELVNANVLYAFAMRETFALARSSRTLVPTAARYARDGDEPGGRD